MKLKSENKIFIWFATGAYGKEIWPGPHYVSDIKKIGKKLTHTLEELLKMDVSDSIKKKLLKAKPGSSVFIHNLHANGDLYVQRLSDDKIKKVEEFRKTNNQVCKAVEKVKTLTNKKNHIRSLLLKK